MLFYFLKNYPKGRLFLSYIVLIVSCLYTIYILYKIGLYWMNNEGSLAWGFVHFFMLFLMFLWFLLIWRGISGQKEKLKKGAGLVK